MANLDGWDWFLFAAGGYLAVTSLVQLMRRRRHVVVDELSAQAALEKRKLEHSKRNEARRKQREAIRDRVA